MSMGSPLKLAIGIATAGRREALSLTLQELARQARLPDRVFICPASTEDCDYTMLPTLPFECEVVHADRGSCCQRNAIIDRCTGFEVVVFFDDDFYPARTYLAEIELLFSSSPEVVAVTGYVIADGALTAGISHEQALALLRADERARIERSMQDVFSLYGCNMAVRVAPLLQSNVRFDENLPLYGWLEDLDLTRRLTEFGRVVRAKQMRGVHLAVKRGRTAGVRFGYSQVANPIYLTRKGILPAGRAALQVARNVGRNCQRLLWPEPWIDRKGRLRGNLLAFADWSRGTLEPGRVVALQDRRRK